MSDAFDVAAVRHFRDARLLESHQRFSNADQLFGFAAECGIKSALLVALGRRSDDDLPDEYWLHVERLWLRAALQSVHRRYPKLVALLKGMSQPFHDWSTRRRYQADDAVTQEAFERHRDAARRVLGSVGLTGALRGS